MKLSIEITPEKATKSFELNGKVFSETWVPCECGYETDGPGIKSQIEDEYGEDFEDDLLGITDLLDAIDGLDVTEIIDVFDGMEETDHA